MEILYSAKAAKYLRKLAKTHKTLAKRIVDEIEAYAQHPTGHLS